MAEPRLYVVSGPSGVGKGTLVKRARELMPELGLTVSATTRPARPGEVDAIDYHFISDERFSELIASGGFIEWDYHMGNRYGTLVSEVQKNLDEGRSVILEIDVSGGANVRRVFGDQATLIFIEPPSLEELERRLRGRGTEDEASIERRLARVQEELERASSYDVHIVNDTLDQALSELLDVLGAATN